MKRRSHADVAVARQRRIDVQARCVQVSVDQPGRQWPTRNKWVRRTLARGDAEGAVALVLAI